MILAEKITLLRKMNGLSQEELAEKLGVSRQSISKWESAQSVPDLKRILAMSELFSVSTDVLLKEEEELSNLPVPVMGSDQELPMERSEKDEEPLRLVSLEEASEFLRLNQEAAGRIAIGVMLCILSPVVLLMLGNAAEAGYLIMKETVLAGIGITILMLMIGCAVGIFIYYGMKMERFEYIQKEPIETAYGVSGMLEERLKKHSAGHVRDMVIGIMLCVLSCIPLFISLILDHSEFMMGIALGILLIMIAIGVMLIVRTNIIKEGLEGLLEEGEYSRQNKLEKRRNETITGIYWSAAIVIYLSISFLTGHWERSWIVWPIAGVGYGLLVAILRAIRTRD